MDNTKSWDVQSNGENYHISVELHNFTGKHKIFLNGNEQYYKASFTEQLVGIQKMIEIPEKKVYVEIKGRRADCAVNGYFLDSGKAFKRVFSLPKWSWIFVIACFAIPIATLGGAVPAVIGILGAMGAAKASVYSNNNVSNFLLALGTTLLAWFALYLFIELWSTII